MTSIDDEVFSQPEATDTRLITKAGEQNDLTSNRESSVRGAIVRGLAEYLAQMQITLKGGRDLRLLDVVESWQDPEQLATYPAAVVYTEEAGTYEADSFTPRTRKLNDGYIIRETCEFVQSVIVDIWCTDESERDGLIAMIEDGFNPVDWMYGFKLVFPHYHNVTSKFSLESLIVLDGSDSAMKRSRLASATLVAQSTQIRFVGEVPALQPRTEVDVT